MYDIVIQLLTEFVAVLPVLIFLRIVLDAIRNYIFKNQEVFMDKLYTGDIPQDYKYARFGSNYIDLFNQQTLHNNVYNYYRVYLYDDLFIYAQDTYTASQYQTVTLPEITVTNDWHYKYLVHK